MPPKYTAAEVKASGLWNLLATRVAIVILLFTVAGLATLAKNAQYYPKSNPASNVSISTKMNVTHAPVQVAAEPSQEVTRVYLPQPPVRVSYVRYERTLPKPPIGVTVTRQHRSPPFLHS